MGVGEASEKKCIVLETRVLAIGTERGGWILEMPQKKNLQIWMQPGAWGKG